MREKRPQQERHGPAIEGGFGARTLRCMQATGSVESCVLCCVWLWCRSNTDIIAVFGTHCRLGRWPGWGGERGGGAWRGGE